MSAPQIDASALPPHTPQQTDKRLPVTVLSGFLGAGKTTLLKEVFKDADIEYIYINCTMGDKKANFFKYLNHEFDKFFRKKLRQEGNVSKALE